MPPEPTDEEVVRQTLADKERFAVLISRYEPKLTRYLRRLGVGVEEDREDVLQNAFLKAYRNLNSFDTDLSFSTWIYRITHNEAMSFFRRRKARPEVSLGEDEEAFRALLADDAADTAASAELRINGDAVKEALAALPEAERDAITLRFFEDRSYAELSDILEIPPGTVATLLRRAKGRLRERLEHHEP
ncbi:MAG: sigma-70 family RNA polymerase sigma factor [Patescibacteria group bacterium]|nr:sigma-70 family RNA polymerase sigma factor [Patescibacteria group bacterium]MDE1966199.1 sigma-70 family RNA polymerase sigma factor [Patescibacteria group bacterium]